MTYTKAIQFGQEQQEVARIAKVLSHPARIAILQHLAETKSCISGDISNALPLSRTTVSQHLQELKSAGLIKGEIDGLTVCYCIDQEQYDRARLLLETMLAAIKSTCCDDSCSC
ncbi:metalloregulator ArsR/SmtB family transcription factor [Pontibacter sp. M82]|uniref:Metalloregulator ArsR/SmtB family transcription factor n=1 Tax=Pontibacter anaerobius TaxID=2993940 RepID=A0ABT3RJQ6_9BACT|nr:metalloregulator ArsR/SmtB family transcription factor [Pontibacter anaerobius]MCX2741795.1 metalloregulator ArsR/SmtB family transcription factor [Pontibacter anaerobius]